MGMPEIIEHQMGGGPIDTFTALFSATAFPGYNTVLKRLRPEYGERGTSWMELTSKAGSARRCSNTFWLPPKGCTCISAQRSAMSGSCHYCNDLGILQ
jgi:hypothetical protein